MQIDNRLGIIGLIVLPASISALTTLAMRPKEQRVTNTDAAHSAIPRVSGPDVVVDRQVVVRSEVASPSAESSSTTLPSVAAVADPVSPMEEFEERIITAFHTDLASNAESQRLEGEIRSILTDRTLRGVRVERVECRASTCQMNLNFANRAADDEAFSRLQVRIVDSRHSILIPTREANADGSLNATAYVYPPPLTRTLPAAERDL